MKTVLFSILLALTLVACNTVPQSVRDGQQLPTTLEMCHSVFIDANDSLYLKELEIKQLQSEIESLREVRK